MKKYLYISIILVMTVILKSFEYKKTKRLNDNDICNKKITNCEKKVKFGDNEICLPLIDNMTEGYGNQTIKRLADKFEYNKNIILAFYLNNKTYSRIKSIKNEKLEDYFKIYVAKSSKDYEASVDLINSLANKMAKNYLKINWSKLKINIQEQLNNISIDRPILIDSYSPHNKVRTQIFLSKLVIEDTEHFMVGTGNLMLINNRLVFSAYYLKYRGIETFEKVKTKNDYLILKLMEENNQ